MHIFISYRRADTGHVAGRLDDRLRTADAVDDVFRDVLSIERGRRFDRAIDLAIEKADVTLVLIGPRYLDGERLNEEDDVVRAEVRSALASAAAGRQKVIPVLVDGAPMPGPHELPEDLSTLSAYNAASLRLASFERDVEALAADIGVQLGRDRSLLGLVIRAVLGAIGGIVAFFAVAALHMEILARSLDESIGRPLVIFLGLAFLAGGAFLGVRYLMRRRGRRR